MSRLCWQLVCGCMVKNTPRSNSDLALWLQLAKMPNLTFMITGERTDFKNMLGRFKHSFNNNVQCRQNFRNSLTTSITLLFHSTQGSLQDCSANCVHGSRNVSPTPRFIPTSMTHVRLESTSLFVHVQCIHHALDQRHKTTCRSQRSQSGFP